MVFQQSASLLSASALLCAACMVQWTHVAAQPAPVALPEVRGVNIHFRSGRQGEVAQLARAFNGSRMDFSWGSVETVKGEYNFSEYDGLTAQLVAQRITPYYILDYNNPLYDGGLSPHTSAGRAAYAAFAAAAVAHYKGQPAIVWELYNEPNGGFWKPKPNATAYGLMALVAARAMKAVDPQCIVLAPTTSGVDLQFMQQVFALGVLDYIDGVSCHPYRDSNPETVLPDYDQVAQLVASYTGRKLPVVAGEWGYTTCSPPSPTCRGAGPVNETVQAQYVVRRFLTDCIARVPISIWYDWVDDGSDQSQREQRFGTVQNQYHAQNASFPLTPKPSFTAAAVYRKLMAGALFVDRVTPLTVPAAMNESSVFVAEFQLPGSSAAMLVAWYATESGAVAGGTVVVPASSGTYSATSMYGEPMPNVTASNGKLSLPVSAEPVYVVMV